MVRARAAALRKGGVHVGVPIPLLLLVVVVPPSSLSTGTGATRGPDAQGRVLDVRHGGNDDGAAGCMVWDASPSPVCPGDVFLPDMRAPCFYSSWRDQGGQGEDKVEVEDEDQDDKDRDREWGRDAHRVGAPRGEDSPERRRALACLPSVLIAGFAKAGTSALAWILASHPQVRKASPKEIHYWDLVVARKEPRHDAASSIDAYAAHFHRDVPHLGADGITFDATPGLVRLGLGARIHAAMPRPTQTLVAVREPTRWLLSCLRFHCKDVDVDVPRAFHAWVGHAIRAKLHAARHATSAAAVLADARAQGRASQGVWCPAADTPLMLDRTFVLHPAASAPGGVDANAGTSDGEAGGGGGRGGGGGGAPAAGSAAPSTRAQRRVRVTCPWVDHLAAWVAAFPLGTSTLVVFGEALASDPRTTMDAVAAFLRLNPHAWDDRVLHAHVNTAAARGPTAIAPDDDDKDQDQGHGDGDGSAADGATARPLVQPMPQTFTRLWPFHSVCARHLAALTDTPVDQFPDEWKYLFGRSA